MGIKIVFTQRYLEWNKFKNAWMNTQERQNLQLEFWNNVPLIVCLFICNLVILMPIFERMMGAWVC